MSSEPCKSPTKIANLGSEKSLIRYIQYVSTCKNCLMISICDRKRMMCPFCGSFYDISIEKELCKIKFLNKNVILSLYLKK